MYCIKKEKQKNMMKDDIMKRALTTCQFSHLYFYKSLPPSRIGQNFIHALFDWCNLNYQQSQRKNIGCSEYEWGKKKPRQSACAERFLYLISVLPRRATPASSPRLQSTWIRNKSNVVTYSSVYSTFCMQVLRGDVIVQIG